MLIVKFDDGYAQGKWTEMAGTNDSRAVRRAETSMGWIFTVSARRRWMGRLFVDLAKLLDSSRGCGVSRETVCGGKVAIRHRRTQAPAALA